MKLTQKAVEKLKPSRKRLQFPDDDLTGFGVRVEPEGQKSFFWFARVNGKLRFRKLGDFPTVSVEQARMDAQKLIGLAADWKRGGYQGADPFEKKTRSEPATVPTFREMTEAYIQRHRLENANRPVSAEYNDRWTIKRHFAGWLDKPIDQITVEDVLRVKNACGDRYHLANRAVEFARAAFNWSNASRDGKINFWRVENPSKDIELHEEKSRERFLQPEELLRFNEALDHEAHADLKDFLILAMTTGARKSDIFSMRWADVHWERTTWTVPYPKNNESYDVSLIPSALAVLERRHKQALESAVHVFPGVGKSEHLKDLKRSWIEFRKRAGIPDVHIHDLRRTCGSYQAISGVPLQQIAAALGHRSMQSTLVYAKLQDQAIRDARESGQAKMLELMKEAKKRRKLTEKKQKVLTVGKSA